MLRRNPAIRMVMAVALMLAVGGVSAEEPGSDAVITLERTSCYGACPVYKITISGDGRVEYEGRSFVRVVGKREAKIDPAAVKKLIQQFEAIHYFELQDKYETIKNPDGTETMISDMPTTLTSLSLNGKSKKIEAYYGVPDELEELERMIDEVAGSKRWVTIDAEQVREEIRGGWNPRLQEGTVLLVKASEAGDAETVKSLLDSGVNVNANDGLRMPIQVANSPEVVRMLIAAGANVNGQIAGQNTDPALHNAVRWRDAATVRELLKDGAQIEARAWDGSTALMRAADRGSPEMIRLLLAAGASVRGTDELGRDVMTWLRNGLISSTNYLYGKKREEVEAGFEESRQLLLKAGATESAGR